MRLNQTKIKFESEWHMQRIRIDFRNETAVAVSIAGTFNNWGPHAAPMIALGHGRWMKELVLDPGTHEYCLVVDGVFLPDPSAHETVKNPFGGVNSLLRVAAQRGAEGRI